jgi:hypothetical protein
MRRLFLSCAVFISACSFHKSELDETLEWMDNTYNPHENISGAYGHGQSAWYTPDSSDSNKEIMVHGLTETFAYRGCDLTLSVEDNPEARKSKDIFTTVKFTFTLRDIDPSSVKVTALAHRGDFSCEEYSEEERRVTNMNCDHAELFFSTRNEAGLVAEDWHMVYPGLTGASHENKHTSKSSNAYFVFNDVEYAHRFAKAFAHAVQLCGGKSPSF